jgi:hypothetical protein
LWKSQFCQRLSVKISNWECLISKISCTVISVYTNELFSIIFCCI